MPVSNHSEQMFRRPNHMLRSHASHTPVVDRALPQ